VAGLQKILLVEDNAELRDIYEFFLKQKGYQVAIASDGDEGLSVAKSFVPDLIFLDIMMPRRDGFGVLRLLRHDPQYHCMTAKIVLLTNLGDESKVSADIRNDMDGYVIKAEIVLKDLVDIIKSLEQPEPQT
jgi:two-component system alkaline phosphatase synthesis response regulator PhoP